MSRDATIQPPATLVGLLQQQAGRYGDKVAFSFSYNGDDEDRTQLTYRELDAQARAIGARLQRAGASGRRVLVFCRPGLDHIAGFFGCLYAGAVAVPVHERLAPRLASVIPDAQADFALAAPDTPAKVKTAVDALVEVTGRPVRWGLTETTAGDTENWIAPDIDADTIAMVQYTSGSTRAPHGVVETHHNLLENTEALCGVWDGDDSAVAVHWLPQHHDMGLSAVLQTVYAAGTTALMSPAAFIKRPVRWLEALSRHRATFTAAPNFAYDKCVECSTPAEREALDLSSLSTAITGAEPVRAETLRAFAEAFAPAGFRPEVFSPAYGLAEVVAMVTGSPRTARPTVHHIDRGTLGKDRIVDAAPGDPGTLEVVGCGRPQGGQRVIIVDPETRRSCGTDQVGEIWVTGHSVAQGYFGRPEETEQAFAAYLADTGEGPFLRTGDLGFLRSGELFITGRCKDLIIIDGINYYPHDIEITVQDSHPALLSGRGAVFSVMPESGGAEQLIVVQETDRDRLGEAEFGEIVAAIQNAITRHHGIAASSVLLVEPRRIPTTSSGKIQRGQTRQQFLDRELPTRAEWHAPEPSTDGDLSATVMKSFTKNRDPVAAAKLAELIGGMRRPQESGLSPPAGPP